jgi:hypothetical protein
MKPLATLIVCLLFLASIGQTSPAIGAAPGKVVLTADMVQSAPDIEAAILVATDGGTHPGVVILDGQKGSFNYAPDALDVDINIWVSDLTLRGINQAKLHGGGISLDGMLLSNIVIEGLSIQCPADCITSPDGLHQNVKVRNNRIEAPNFGIAVGPGAADWLIEKNRITAGNIAVQLLSTTGIKVVNNQLSAGVWGVTLESACHKNQIIANSIVDVQAGGIALGPESLENKVHANRVTCAPEAPACVIVYDEGTDNRIKGNK